VSEFWEQNQWAAYGIQSAAYICFTEKNYVQYIVTEKTFINYHFS